MDKVLNLIYENMFLIIWIVLALISAFAMGKQWFQSKAYTLMLLAKKLAKDKALSSGAEQEEFVVTGLYIVLKRLKIPFVTKEGLQPIVHKLYMAAMDYLDDGKLNNSVK